MQPCNHAILDYDLKNSHLMRATVYETTKTTVINMDCAYVIILFVLFLIYFYCIK